MRIAYKVELLEGAGTILPGIYVAKKHLPIVVEVSNPKHNTIFSIIKAHTLIKAQSHIFICMYSP